MAVEIPSLTPARLSSARWNDGYIFVDYATQGYQVLVLSLILLFHGQAMPRWPLAAGAHILAIGFSHWLIRRCRSRSANSALAFLRHFYPVLMYTWFFTETGFLNRMFSNQYFDPMVMRMEEAIFRGQPSLEFMTRLPYLWISEVLYASYFSYYMMIVGVGIALYMRNKQQFYHYIAITSFLFYVCYTIYIFVPVIGPRIFLSDQAAELLPPHLLALAPTEMFPPSIRGGIFYRIMQFIYETFEPVGAAIPSSHVAVSICTVFFSKRYLPKIWVPHLVVAVLLCISTVYCRYHYAVDVLAGAMTALLCIPVANWLYRRLEREPKAEPRQGVAQTVPS